MFTVSVAVTAELLATCMGWVTEHMGASVTLETPVTAQLRVTTPVNPFSGMIVIFDVAVVPELASVAWLASSENVPGG